MAVAQVRDVAALAGVSTGTVSNALNHPEKVSAATLARIQAAIEELGFVRNEAAHRLRRGVNQSVGMLVLDISNPFFTDIAAGVEKGLASLGRPLLLGNSAQDIDRELAYLDTFEEQHLSGVLITPVGHDLDRLRRLRNRGTAVVLVDRMAPTKDFSSVGVDDQLGGRLGRRTPPRRRPPQDRLRRRPGAHRPGLGPTRGGARGGGRASAVVELIFYESAAMDFAAGRTAVEQILALSPSDRPDAVMAANDLIAIGALQALTLAGLSVPDDIAIIGYDDIEFAGSAAIPLTSIRQPAYEVGKDAIELLLEVIANPDETTPKQVLLKPELVVRRSTDAN